MSLFEGFDVQFCVVEDICLFSSRISHNLHVLLCKYAVTAVRCRSSKERKDTDMTENIPLVFLSSNRQVYVNAKSVHQSLVYLVFISCRLEINRYEVRTHQIRTYEDGSISASSGLKTQIFLSRSKEHVFIWNIIFDIQCVK
jgi:hypothetical protein